MTFRIDPAGWPFVIGALAGAGLTALLATPLTASPILVLAGLFAAFFRDPDRHGSDRDGDVLSPADGRVLVAGAAQPDGALAGEWKQVSIFLSPLDVHVNRIPVSGQVTAVHYRPGTFLPAYREDAGRTNEQCEIWVEQNGRFVVARQIVGILARRVVCRRKPGDQVQAGDRYGVMKFGSRMDVFLPATATIRVKVGQSVRGGETVIAVLD